MEMSTSSFTVKLGVDPGFDLSKLKGDYQLLTTAGNSGTRLYDALVKDEDGTSASCFHIGLSVATLPGSAGPVLTIDTTPTALQKWIELRSADRQAYRERKERKAGFLVDQVERYLLPGLRENNTILDIASPATYARYSSSPTGSIYDMAPLVANAGNTRLKMKTPLRGLYLPHFIHGIYGALLGGMQVVDEITDGKVIKGRVLPASQVSG